MMQISDYKKVPGGTIPGTGAAYDRGMSSGKPENIQTQLDEARFISSFMAAVCNSLELDDICSIAARALYCHATYFRIIFAFSADLEGKTVIFSPKSRKGTPAARPNLSVVKSCSSSAMRETTSTSTHIALLDNMGTITIDYKAGQGKSLSESLISSVASYFSLAIRNALEHGRMKDLAMLDGLTKLFNRRHQAGDQVLVTVARILKESCRGNDLVARFGGEEFAIILSQTQTATAHIVAQRIKNRLAKYVFTFDNRQFHMTASIGLATCQAGSPVFTSKLVKQADHALYQAKRTGKNKICAFRANLQTDVTFSQGVENFGALIHARC
jgi:two-component system, cell cycle response regulator